MNQQERDELITLRAQLAEAQKLNAEKQKALRKIADLCENCRSLYDAITIAHHAYNGKYDTEEDPCTCYREMEDRVDSLQRQLAEAQAALETERTAREAAEKHAAQANRERDEAQQNLRHWKERAEAAERELRTLKIDLSEFSRAFGLPPNMRPTEDAIALILERSSKTEAAERDRDAVLNAIGFKGGPLTDDHREVVLSDARGLRPEMVKARNRCEELLSKAQLTDMLIESRGGLLSKAWNMFKAAEARADELKRKLDKTCEIALRHAATIGDMKEQHERDLAAANQRIAELEQANASLWKEANVQIDEARADQQATIERLREALIVQALADTHKWGIYRPDGSRVEGICEDTEEAVWLLAGAHYPKADGYYAARWARKVVSDG